MVFASASAIRRDVSELLKPPQECQWQKRLRNICEYHWAGKFIAMGCIFDALYH